MGDTSAVHMKVDELQQQQRDGDGGLWQRQCEALQQQKQQLLRALRDVQDIHGITMPLLHSDQGLVSELQQHSGLALVPSLQQPVRASRDSPDGSEASRSADGAQNQLELKQRLAWMEQKVMEYEGRVGEFKRRQLAQEASGKAAAARAAELEAQV
jgi:hypothetical protein